MSFKTLRELHVHIIFLLSFRRSDPCIAAHRERVVVVRAVDRSGRPLHSFRVLLWFLLLSLVPLLPRRRAAVCRLPDGRQCGGRKPLEDCCECCSGEHCCAGRNLHVTCSTELSMY